MEFIVEPKSVFNETIGEKGDGSLVAFKIALQTLDPDIVVVSPGSISRTAKCLPQTTYVTEKPLSAARMLSQKYTIRGKETSILVISGDVATENNLSEFENADENVVYICLNNGGSSSNNMRKDVETQLTPKIHASYAATASVAFPEDYMQKLINAKNNEGLSFIEVHCPSPKLWGYEPANTIIISRSAVACHIWPLYETRGERTKSTHQSDVMEPVDRYVNIQNRFTELDLEILKEIVSKNTRKFPASSREI